MPIPSNNIFTYLLSLFGFGPAKTEHVIQHPTFEESSCSFQTESTLYVSHPDIHENNKKRTTQDIWAFQDWISRLSKVALCQILTSTVSECPQLADRIEHFYGSFASSTAAAEQKKDDDWLDSIVFIQERANTVAHSLDNLRPSEQFGRAFEVAESIQGLIHLCTQHRQTMPSLFGLIILAQESLHAPVEVRQHVFYHSKLGRSIILELASALKNFKQTPHLSSCGQWERVSCAGESWVDALDRVCIKLARYDVTWEYRQEYSQVVEIATRLYNTKMLR
ncbi:hypothetical protein K501DRAFT_288269 [Backusella circina FSU 941]|nr:hypothetical protein K501DRAFT_288269 [Backusella circina FSU 941]